MSVDDTPRPFIEPGADHLNHIARNRGDIEALCGAALMPINDLSNADWDHCETCMGLAQ